VTNAVPGESKTNGAQTLLRDRSDLTANLHQMGEPENSRNRSNSFSKVRANRLGLEFKCFIFRYLAEVVEVLAITSQIYLKSGNTFLGIPS
jgi:hypothetical protein